MKKWSRILSDGVFSLMVLAGTAGLNLLLIDWFDTRSMVSTIFVLGVFLISWHTWGYTWGILASLISVLLVNYIFTYPYWAFDLISPECIVSAAIMLTVAVMTSTLTTLLKRQEKMKGEAERERMRSNLLRAVSHDLRTPLTGIYGACSALRENYDHIPRDRQLKMLEDVCGDAQWLVRMVENLLSVTRIDAGTVTLNKRDTVVEELVDAVLVKFRKRYPGQMVHVELPEEFLMVPMDAMLIEQVLMNLLENAVVHARGMGNLWLMVRVRGSRVTFRVEDDGCGIPGEDLDRIFNGLTDRENRADTGRKGMGIGLSVCRSIIRAHGGEITAGNRPQGGAVFRFQLEMEEKHGK